MDLRDVTETTAPIRVVVADDHHIWRSGVRADLGDGFDVVGEAEDADGTIAAIDEHRPDLAVVDLHMPGGGGLSVVRSRAEVVPIVILTVSEAERDLLDAVASGAVGYLVKSTRPEQLRAALRTAAGGEPVFSPQLAALVLSEFRRMAGGGGPTGDEASLTVREREVLGQVARGHSYAEVGETLFISPKTVSVHLSNTMRKLGVDSRTQAVLVAHGAGLVPEG